MLETFSGGPVKNETVEVKREHFSEGGQQGSVETTVTTSTEEQTIPIFRWVQIPKFGPSFSNYHL